MPKSRQKKNRYAQAAKDSPKCMYGKHIEARVSSLGVFGEALVGCDTRVARRHPVLVEAPADIRHACNVVL